MKMLKTKESWFVGGLTLGLLCTHIFIQPIADFQLVSLGLLFLAVAIVYHGVKRDVSNFMSAYAAVFILVGSIGMMTNFAN